jgi:hypothetical protein
MRRAVFVSFGALELVVAVVLIRLGSQIPTDGDVDQTFRSAGRVTNRAGTQVQLLRQQVQSIQRLELHRLTERLQKQTRSVTVSLGSQRVDFDTVSTLRDILGEVAIGLRGLSDTLDPVRFGKLGAGLGETAAFLEERVVPSAHGAAAHMERSTEALRKDAGELAVLLKDAPPDLKAVRGVYDSLGRFREGLERMSESLKLQRIDTMREGFAGLEDSLLTGSEQVERLASYTYPAVTFNGLKPSISQRSFWPEGSRIAQGMRKAAAGATAAAKEMDSMATDLPQIRASLYESCNVVDKVKEALQMALKHQDRIEPLLKEAPTHAARLTEELPRIGKDLAQMLRDTSKLKEVARALRQAQQGIDTVVSRWPELQTTLSRMATALHLTHNQLDQAIKHRHEYELAMQETVDVANAFATMLPLVTDQLDCRLADEDQTLAELGQSLNEVHKALPAYAAATTKLLQTGRLLAWLVAAIVGLHGVYLLFSARFGVRVAG